MFYILELQYFIQRVNLRLIEQKYILILYVIYSELCNVKSPLTIQLFIE